MKRKIFLFSLIFVALICIMNLSHSKVSAAVEYNVTFDYNADSIAEYLPSNLFATISNQTIKVEEGYTAHITNNYNSYIDNYYSLSWTYNDEVIDLDGFIINSDTTFVALWTPIVWEIQYKYTTESSEITNIKYEDEYSIESGDFYLYTPDRPYYYFIDWYSDPSYPSNGIVIYIPKYSLGVKMVYPKWIPIQYTINYNTDAKNYDNPRSYNIESPDYILSDPEREGYIFRGWYLDEDFTQACTIIRSGSTGNINLYPKWEAIKYMVTYIMPDGSKQEVVAEYGTTAEAPKTNKSIFEIVTYSRSRKNISEDTTIKVSYINIWYLYLIVIIIAIIVILSIIIKRKIKVKRLHKLRLEYQARGFVSRKKRKKK